MVTYAAPALQVHSSTSLPWLLVPLCHMVTCAALPYGHVCRSAMVTCAAPAAGQAGCVTRILRRALILGRRLAQGARHWRFEHGRSCLMQVASTHAAAAGQAGCRTRVQHWLLQGVRA